MTIVLAIALALSPGAHTVRGGVDGATLSGAGVWQGDGAAPTCAATFATFDCQVDGPATIVLAYAPAPSRCQPRPIVVTYAVDGGPAQQHRAGEVAALSSCVYLPEVSVWPTASN